MSDFKAKMCHHIRQYKSHVSHHQRKRRERYQIIERNFYLG